MSIDNIEEKLKKLRKAIDDDDLKNLSVVDDLDASGDDEAEKWLAEQKSQPKEKTKNRYSKKWKAEDVDEDIAKKIKDHMGKGYSEEEAHWQHGSQKYHNDLRAAMKSGVDPQLISDKFHGDHKEMVSNWLNNVDRVDMKRAHADTNPLKHAAGQMLDAHEKYAADYKTAYSKFLNEDASNLKGRERHNAIKEWKKGWHGDNPEYKQGLSEISGQHAKFGEARKTAKQSLQDKMDAILTGGGTAGETFSAKEGAQHLGIDSKDLGEGSTFRPQKDPLAAFGANSPKLMSALNEERQTRLKRIDSAAKAQSVVRKPKEE